ncbi:AAA family ATPase [Clostridium coskatii]|uniref:Shikimate kinase n=1 Tax=Clostridium coskatii TaxID=1705578 RepID=A0A166TA97_9CLOT|nr:AAA family ATPase [Clostridium coskatii]OAA93430.1 Shikimate kinase [Clostridium coskatii]OBR96219.1 shikimate kinase [Clostridium coskatii]
MARGIIIFGSSGSGKTTLGKLVAKKFDFPYFDIDDYIWRKDTDKPFTVMYTHEEKINRLMTDISKGTHFVMAGSMDSFNPPFVPLFDLAIHITASIDTRISRINKREYEVYGERIMKGGDMYEEHCRFLDNSARYDTDGSPCMRTHVQWANSLPCKVLQLNGDEDLNKNAEIIVHEYLKQDSL